MNRILYNKLSEYLKLNPIAINRVFNEFGISQNVKIGVEAVVDAVKVFKEPFAIAVFNAIYPQINEGIRAGKIQAPQFSSFVGDPSTNPVLGATDNAEVAEKTNFWQGFSSILNALVQVTPVVTNGIVAVKNGTSQGSAQAYPTAQYMQAPASSGISNSVLIYIGIGFVAIVSAIIIFKKMN